MPVICRIDRGATRNDLTRGAQSHRRKARRKKKGGFQRPLPLRVFFFLFLVRIQTTARRSSFPHLHRYIETDGNGFKFFLNWRAEAIRKRAKRKTTVEGETINCFDFFSQNCKWVPDRLTVSSFCMSVPNHLKSVPPPPTFFFFPFFNIKEKRRPNLRDTSKRGGWNYWQTRAIMPRQMMMFFRPQRSKLPCL